MATASTTFAPTNLERPLGQTLAIYFKEAKYEFLTRLRLRAYSISTISFPLMFYVLFGLVLNSKDAPVGGIGDRNLLDPDLRHVRSHGRLAVWHGVRISRGAGIGMVAGETRQSHAAVRLFHGEGRNGHDFQRGCGAAFAACLESRLAECTCLCWLQRSWSQFW